MTAKNIYVTEGEIEYIGGTVTETTGKNISADPIKVALGPLSPPPLKASAVTADVDTQGATVADRLIKLLVGSGTPLGEGRYLWAWVTDSPEIEPIRLDGPINIR